MAIGEATRSGAALHYIRMDRTVRDAVRLLAQPGTDALVVIDGRREGEGAIVGLVTERDVFRAIAARGLDTLDALVWTLAQEDFATVEVGAGPTERLAAFCAHRTDRIAVTDGFALRSIQTIWDCLAAPSDRMGAAAP
jgi:CBS domain-containing protein